MRLSARTQYPNPMTLHIKMAMSLYTELRKEKYELLLNIQCPVTNHPPIINTLIPHASNSALLTCPIQGILELFILINVL